MSRISSSGGGPTALAAGTDITLHEGTASGYSGQAELVNLSGAHILHGGTLSGAGGNSGQIFVEVDGVEIVSTAEGYDLTSVSYPTCVSESSMIISGKTRLEDDVRYHLVTEAL